MRRKIGFAATMLILAVAPMLGQDLLTQPAPASDIVGPQLIAWSQLQKPQPVSPMISQSAQSSQREESQSNPAQTLTGTVVKDGGQYVLKVSDSTAYRLDDQEKAKQYEGKQVKIAGTLDAAGNTFHVTSIELIS
jgi:hypothetical protein